MHCLINRSQRESNIFLFYYIFFSIFVQLFSCQNAGTAEVSFQRRSCFGSSTIYSQKMYSCDISFLTVMVDSNQDFLKILRSTKYCNYIPLGILSQFKVLQQSHFHNSINNGRNVEEVEKKKE